MKFWKRIKYQLALRWTKQLLQPASGRGSWTTIVDTTTGFDFQIDATLNKQSILKQATVFRCIAQIAGDVSKLALRLMEYNQDWRMWQEAPDNPAYTPVIRRPNHFQLRHEFLAHWSLSLLQDGNTYVFKGRDENRLVRRLTVLEPSMITPMVAPDGGVFYRISGADWLAGILNYDFPAIPASEIIHEKYLTLNHPLIGASPLQVAGASATAAHQITEHNKSFFGNQARPSGILSTPDEISQDQADALKTAWNSAFTGTNSGKVAVLEGNLKFEPLTTKSVDAQLLEILGFSQEDICRAFGVPGWKVGVGEMPPTGGVDASERRYYNDVLHVRLHGIEQHMGEGIGLNQAGGRRRYALEFDVRRGLFRMDALTAARVAKEEVGAGILAPNEGRRERGLVPVEGGDTPYLQQQNYSLAALSKRNAAEDPFASASQDTEPKAEEEKLELDDDLQEQVDSGEITEEEAQEEQAERIFRHQLRS